MPRTEWTIADAKSKLSELLSLADQETQIITRGDRHFVVMTGDAYRRLTGAQPILKELILSGPNLQGVDLNRDQERSRAK